MNKLNKNFSNLTPSALAKRERNRRIVEAYQAMKGEYTLRLELYLAISKKVGVSHVTCYKVLKNEGVL